VKSSAPAPEDSENNERNWWNMRAGLWIGRLPLARSIILLSALLMAPAFGSEREPTPEQLFAACLHAADLGTLQPAGWWDDEPEFNGRFDPRPGLVFYLVGSVIGQPDNDPANVSTTLSLYTDPAASAAAFAATAATDTTKYGDVVAGPPVGDESRYLRSAKTGSEANASVRFRRGRYLGRIDFGGAGAAVDNATLARLAQLVIARLNDLDAGKLVAPPLPALAERLPDAGDPLGPILGTAAGTSVWWSWIRDPETHRMRISPQLREVLHKTVGNGVPVARAYQLGAQPDNKVSVTIMPFINAQAAAQYRQEDAREQQIPVPPDNDQQITPRRLAGDNGAYDDVQFRRGRYVADVACWAPFGQTSPACAAAVRAVAERLAERLPAD
jgi:hypothetical protein